jgi:Uma2 family endonuclease
MTADELFALPEDDRTDRRLIRGRLVERPYPFRTPDHAAAGANLSRLLSDWRHTTGPEWKVYGYGCPYRIERDPDTLVCFDGSVVQSEHRPVDKWVAYVDAVPQLVAEVVDESDPAEAVKELLQAAVDAGVPVVWAVEPVLELIDEWRPGQGRRTYGCGNEIDVGDMLPGLRVMVHEVFE